MKVAVLGCGPAGMLAAHAAFMAGAPEVHILSTHRDQSTLHGAQFLHEKFPLEGFDWDSVSGYIKYAYIGDAKGYAAKVYGDKDHPVSWTTNGQIDGHSAYDIRAVYDELWYRYEDLILVVSRVEVRQACKVYDLVVSTIPRPATCWGGHGFVSKTTWISDAQIIGTEEDRIVYNGDPGDRWSRYSCIFGHAQYEAPTGRRSMATPVDKPTRTNCDCSAPNLLRVGRYGSWRKEYLVHMVYAEVQDAVHKLLS